VRDVSNKTAFITGAASGVGYGMAHAFLEAGMRVVIADIRGDAIEAAVKSLGGKTAGVYGIRLDVTDRAAMAAAAGVGAVGVAWGYHPVGDLRAAGASAILERFEELLELVADGAP